MKHIATITTFAAMIFAGSSMADNAFPCSKAQFWITSMETVPAGAQMHRNNQQINVAERVLNKRVEVAGKKYQEVVAAK